MAERIKSESCCQAPKFGAILKETESFIGKTPPEIHFSNPNHERKNIF